MADKVVVDEVENLLNSSGRVTLNENTDKLAKEFDKVLYADGSVPLKGTVDADSNRIINLPDAVTPSEPVTLRQSGAFTDAVAALNSYYPTKELGEAATPVGQYFTYPDGNGQILYAERLPVGSQVIGQVATQAAIDAIPAALASPSGAGMVGLYAGTAPFAYTTVQAALTGMLSTGTIHGSALGLVNSSVLDQFDKLRDAIAYCNERKMTLDITGLEIRVGTQNTVDPKYLYLALRTGPVSGSFQLGETVFGDVSGANILLDEIVVDYVQPGRRRLGGAINGTFQIGEPLIGANSGATATLTSLAPYAIRIPTGGWMRIVGKGTIGNLEAESRQTLFFADEAAYVEIGDGVTIDGNSTKADLTASPIQSYGSDHIHIGQATFTRCGIARLGASPNGMTRLCTFTDPTFEDGVGTHCIGGKPGGCARWEGNSLRFERCRGGWNIEAEDQDGMNDDGTGTPLWDTNVIASARSVIGIDIDGDATKSDGSPDQSSVHLVGVGDAAGAVVDIGSITLLGAVSSIGTADALVVGGGQTDLSPAKVTIGSIHVENALQVWTYSAAPTGGETVKIGSITGSGVEDIFVAIPLGGGNATTTPGMAKLIRMDLIQFGSVTRRGFRVENNSPYAGDIINRLSVGTYQVDSISNPVGAATAAYIKDVVTVEFGIVDYDEVVAVSPGSGTWNTAAFYADVGTFRVTERFRQGSSWNQGPRIIVSALDDINGLDINGVSAGAGFYPGGSGKHIIRGFIGGNTAVAVNGVAMAGGTVELRDLYINGQTINNLIPDVIQGGDYLSTTVTHDFGAVAASDVATKTDVSLPGARAGDTFTITPTTVPSDKQYLRFEAWVSSNNTVTIACYNTDAANPHSPGSLTFKLQGQR